MKAPKISVTFSFYNDAKYLHDSISSILDQSFQDIELIMLDNGSTDNSFEIANFYAKKDQRIKIIKSEKNYFGGGINQRKLLKHVNGQYVKLFCADDIMLPNCLEKLVNFLDNNINYIACFANLMRINEEGKPLNKNTNCTIKNNRFEYLNHIFYHHSAFTFPTFMIRREFLTKEMMDLRLIHFYDIKLWIETLKKGEVFVIEENLVKYRIRNNQGNVSKISKSQKRMRSYLLELHLIYDEFFKIDNFDLFQKIFPESKKYISKLDEKQDQNMLPLITAILLYNNAQICHPFYFNPHKNIALLKIFDLIKDENISIKMEQKLGIEYQKIRDLSSSFFTNIMVKRNKIQKLIFKFLKKTGLKKSEKSTITI